MMPIRYERDDARRRVVVIVQGTIEPDDAFAVIERQCLDDVWSYGLLYDRRHMTGRLDPRRAASSPGSGRAAPFTRARPYRDLGDRSPVERDGLLVRGPRKTDVDDRGVSPS
jgi:hypothetical protein